MVGPTVGQDFGGILNRDWGECPESLTRDWEYYMSVSVSGDDQLCDDHTCQGLDGLLGGGLDAGGQM